MSENSHERLVVLANGASVSLGAVVANLGLLRSYLESPDSEWDVVYHLREVCLGRTIDAETARTLIHEGLLQPDGNVETDLRAVVLSAVRGEGRLLHVTSPFTDPLDRAMVEYLNADDYLESHLERSAKEAFLADNPLKNLRAAIKRLDDNSESRQEHDLPGMHDRIVGRLEQDWIDRTRSRSEGPGEKTP